MTKDKQITKKLNQKQVSWTFKKHNVSSKIHDLTNLVDMSPACNFVG